MVLPEALGSSLATEDVPKVGSRLDNADDRLKDKVADSDQTEGAVPAL
jgi:hypothetical protein